MRTAAYKTAEGTAIKKSARKRHLQPIAAERKRKSKREREKEREKGIWRPLPVRPFILAVVLAAVERPW